VASNELVLAAACIAGVDRVFTIGVTQAVAAGLAPGVPPVDRSSASLVAATPSVTYLAGCGIDMIAGPSEILMVCDGQTDQLDRHGPVLRPNAARSAVGLVSQFTFLDRVTRKYGYLPTLEREAL
jgi:histidinol dehydrogenase